MARDASSSSAPSSLMMEQVLSWSPENLSVIPRLSFQAADPSERAAATALTQMSSFPPPLGVVEAKSSSESDETESFTTSPPPPPHHHAVQQHHHHHHQKTTTAGTSYRPKTVLRRSSKTHVPSACVNCKRAHLACDVGRPCRRCISLGKQSTCEDVQHKKRGRPKLKDRSPVAVSSTCLIPKKGKSAETQSANEETYSATQPRRMMSVSMPHLLHSGGDPSSSSTTSNLGGDVAGNNVIYQPYETRPFFSPPLLPTYFPQGLLTISPSQPPPLPPPPPQPRMIYQLPKFDITNDMMATLTTSASNHPTPLEPSNSFRVFSPAVRSSVFPPTANATPSPTALALGAGAGVTTGRVSAQEKVLSLVLTADNLLICQASSECREFWNLEPSFLMGRSLYSLVPMKDHEKLHRLQGNALKAAGFTDSDISFVANYCEADPFAFQFLDLPRLIEHAHGWPNDEGFFGSTEAFSDSIGINASPQLIRQFRVNISFGGGGYGADISRRSTLARGGCLVLEVRTFGWVDAARDEDVPMRERLY